MDKIGLTYNTEKEQIVIPEYGRCIQEMIKKLPEIEDRQQRTEAAKYIISVMVQMNPQIKESSDYEHKLWDHLYMMAGYDLDIDAPFPAPAPEERSARPMVIPIEKNPIRYNHYGRNIESIIDLIASEPEGEVKQALLRSLATYMRQQYLIWNKDSVADETIFADIEKISGYRIKVPSDLELSKISSDSNFSRPGFTLNPSGGRKNQRKGNRKNKR